MGTQSPTLVKPQRRRNLAMRRLKRRCWQSCFQLKRLMTLRSVEELLSILITSHLSQSSQNHFIALLRGCKECCTCTCIYPVANDRWGATDVATLSLHFILFSASFLFSLFVLFHLFWFQGFHLSCSFLHFNMHVACTFMVQIH